MELRILKDPEVFNARGIAEMEQRFHAKYVCDTCLRDSKGGWRNSMVAVFWNRDPANIPKGGSPWFGLFYNYPDLTLYVTNALSAAETPITGVVAKNGDVIYSRYRHDYRVSPDGTAMVDGGRDYFRTGPFGIGTVELGIVDGELKITRDMVPWETLEKGQDPLYHPDPEEHKRRWDAALKDRS